MGDCYTPGFVPTPKFLCKILCSLYESVLDETINQGHLCALYPCKNITLEYALCMLKILRSLSEFRVFFKRLKLDTTGEKMKKKELISMIPL